MDRFIVFLLLIVFPNTGLFGAGSIKQHLKVINCPLPDAQAQPANPIYVINLDERVNKWDSVKSELDKHNLTFCRFSAINGWKLSSQALKDLLPSKIIYDANLSPGRIGCALSHISIWNHAYQNNYKLIWVLEDDCEFLDSPYLLTERIEELSAIDPYWDILYTDPNCRDWDGVFINSSKPITSHPSALKKKQKYFSFRKNVSPNIVSLRSRWGTYSMIISKRGIKKLLKYHMKNKIWTSIDVSIHHVPNIRQYALINPIVTHTITNRKSDTDHDPGDPS